MFRLNTATNTRLIFIFFHVNYDFTVRRYSKSYRCCRRRRYRHQNTISTSERQRERDTENKQRIAKSVKFKICSEKKTMDKDFESRFC